MSHNEPLIQIVDKHDQVIGALPMKEAKAQGKIHRIARVMAENSNGRVLLQRRSGHVPYPGKWDSSSAGHVDEGETYKEAAKRETLEELGIKVDELEALGTFYHETENYFDGPTIKQFNKAFKIKLDHTPDNFNKEEVDEIKWFTVEELKKMVKDNPELLMTNLVVTIEKYY